MSYNCRSLRFLSNLNLNEMKKLICLILIFISLDAFAPAVNSLTIIKSESINPYEKIWEAICAVESSNNPNIINHKEGAYGLVQVRKARLSDFNRESGQSYSLIDCLRPDVSKIVFMHNAVRFNPADYRLIARDWNKSKTDIYWEKVNKQLKNL